MSKMTEVDGDSLVEVFISAIPDMTSEELGQIEFAISVELQERASKARSSPTYQCNCIGCRMQRGEPVEY